MKIYLASSAFDEVLLDCIRDFLNALGHCTILSKLRRDEQRDQLSSSLRQLMAADAFIADVSDLNPSVFYELGVRIGGHRSVIIASRDEGSVPEWLKDLPYVNFSGDPLRDAQTICRRILPFERTAPTKDATSLTAEATLRAATLDPQALEQISPDRFERLVAELLVGWGYDVSTVVEADQGADLIIRSKENQLLAVVQAKKMDERARVSLGAVRELRNYIDTHGEPTRGILVTSSSYTPAAMELAASHKIDLLTIQDVLAAGSKGHLFRPRGKVDPESVA